VTRGWLPQRAGSLGLNGGGAAAAVRNRLETCTGMGMTGIIPAGMEANVAGAPQEWTYNLAGLPRECLFILPYNVSL